MNGSAEAALPRISHGDEVCRVLSLTPAAEYKPAKRETKPKSAYGEAADSQRFAPRGQSLPAPERVALLLRERLATPLFADGAARP